MVYAAVVAAVFEPKSVTYRYTGPVQGPQVGNPRTVLLALDPYVIALAAARAVVGSGSGLQKIARVEWTMLRARAAREGGLGVGPKRA